MSIRYNLVKIKRYLLIFQTNDLYLKPTYVVESFEVHPKKSISVEREVFWTSFLVIKQIDVIDFMWSYDSIRNFIYSLMWFLYHLRYIYIFFNYYKFWKNIGVKRPLATKKSRKPSTEKQRDKKKLDKEPTKKR